MKNFHAILNCQHAYCLECIKDWSQVCNLCPLCKKEFIDILHIDPCRTIIESIKVEPKKIHIEEEADGNNDFLHTPIPSFNFYITKYKIISLIYSPNSLLLILL